MGTNLEIDTMLKYVSFIKIPQIKNFKFTDYVAIGGFKRGQLVAIVAGCKKEE